MTAAAGAARSSEARDRSLGRGLRVSLVTWLVTRVGFLVAGGLSQRLWPPVTPAHRTGWAWIMTEYDRYDSGHFLAIEARGYFWRGPTEVNVAFFPGYPMVSHQVAVLLGVGHETDLDRYTAFTLVSWFSALLAAVLLWRLVADEVSESAATVAVVMLLAGPDSHTLMASYSEGLFLCFALGAWLLARRDSFSWAAVLCAGAALVRINGLFLAGGLIMMAVTAARAGRLDRRGLVALLTLPTAAVLSYFAFLKIHTGHWDAWFRAQRAGWHREFTPPWRSLLNTVGYLDHLGGQPAREFEVGTEFPFAALYLVALVALARRRLWPELAYTGLTAASLLTSTFYQSVPRSTLVVFPLFVLAARVVTTTRHRLLVAPAVVASTILLALNTVLFLHT